MRKVDDREKKGEKKKIMLFVHSNIDQLERRTVAQSLYKVAKNPKKNFFEIYLFFAVFWFPLMWDDMPKHF